MSDVAPKSDQRSVASLLVSLVASFGVAGAASAIVLGLIPATRHAAQRHACADGSGCTSAYLLLAVPGLALALATLVGAVAWAIVRVRRHRRGGAEG
jgi:hypothetical protein